MAGTSERRTAREHASYLAHDGDTHQPGLRPGVDTRVHDFSNASRECRWAERFRPVIRSMDDQRAASQTRPRNLLDAAGVERPTSPETFQPRSQALRADPVAACIVQPASAVSTASATDEQRVGGEPAECF